jgi:predicted secreted protein
MAIYTGKGLVVKFGSDTLTHVRSASATTSIGTVETTAAADTVKGYITTTSGFEASVDMLCDDTTDLFDSELAVGTSAAFIINPEGVASGAVKISGTALVTAVDFSTPYDGLIAAKVSLLGTTALTIGVNP